MSPIETIAFRSRCPLLVSVGSWRSIAVLVLVSLLGTTIGLTQSLQASRAVDAGRQKSVVKAEREVARLNQALDRAEQCLVALRSAVAPQPTAGSKEVGATVLSVNGPAVIAQFDSDADFRAGDEVVVTRRDESGGVYLVGTCIVQKVYPKTKDMELGLLKESRRSVFPEDRIYIISRPASVSSVSALVE